MDHLVVMTTTETEAQSLELARKAIDQNLAACVQVVGPIRSVYRWQGEICSGNEFRCEMKTSKPSFSALSEMLREHHPYDVPEIIALPIVEASHAYAQWLDEQLGN